MVNRKIAIRISASDEHEKFVREALAELRDTRPPRRILELAATLQKLLDKKQDGDKLH